MTTTNECSVDGCPAVAHAQKLCSMHYQRLKKFGTTELRGAGVLGAKDAAAYLKVSAHTLLSKERKELIKVGRDAAGRRAYRMDDLRRWQDEGIFSTEEVKRLLTRQEAAVYLGISPSRLRRREETGEIGPIRDGGGLRRYRTEDLDRWVSEGLFERRFGGKAAPELFAERVRLSYADEQECMKIARKAARVAIRKISILNWDDAISDAMDGVALALSRPSNTCDWRVHCYTQAYWHVLQGARKLLGKDLARQLPLSLDAAEDYEQLRLNAFVAPSENGILTRLEIGNLLDQLTSPQRVVLVNTVAHRFTDREVAEDMGVRMGDVQRLRADAIFAIREYVDAIHQLFGMEAEQKSA